MIGTPGSYFEKEEKFLRECVRKQHAKENEEWFLSLRRRVGMYVWV